MKKILVYIFFLLLVANSLLAATYYVDNGGSGSGTLADPWSVTQVNAQALSNDDVVIFRSGQEYTTVITGASVNATGVTFRASVAADDDGCTNCWSNADWSVDGRPWLDGDNIANPINITNANFDNGTISGFEVRGTNATGTDSFVIRVDSNDAIDSFTITNCKVDGHTGDDGADAQLGRRGGIGVYDMPGTIVISDNIVQNLMRSDVATSNLHSSYNCGAACDSHGFIYWEDSNGFKTTGSITFSGNTTENIWGDAIHMNRVRVPVYIYDNTFGQAYEEWMDFKGVNATNDSSYYTHIYENTGTHDITIGQRQGISGGGGGISLLIATPTSGGFSSNLKIYNNYFYGTGKAATAIGRGYAEVYNNYFEDNCIDILMTDNLAGTDEYYVFNNVSKKTSATHCRDDSEIGSFLQVGKNSTTDIYGDLFVYNNSVYIAAAGAGHEGRWGIKGYSDDVTGSIYVKNNIFYIDHASGLAQDWDYDSGQVTSDYNLYDGAGDITDPTSLKTGDSVGDGSANFNDIAGDDFSLASNSDAIDVGVDLGVTYDDGWDSATSMPPTTIDTLDQDSWGDAWEIGAYVYSTGGGGSGYGPNVSLGDGATTTFESGDTMSFTVD